MLTQAPLDGIHKAKFVSCYIVAHGLLMINLLKC